MSGRQSESDRFTPRLIAVAMLGLPLFMPPLMSLFDRNARVFGMPILMAYLFIAWAVVIGLVAAIKRGSGPPPD